MTTAAVLEWWFTFAPTLQWTWAKTYATRAPHWYVVAGQTPSISHGDFVMAGRVIRAFGEPGKFWSMTQLYLHVPNYRTGLRIDARRKQTLGEPTFGDLCGNAARSSTLVSDLSPIF